MRVLWVLQASNVVSVAEDVAMRCLVLMRNFLEGYKQVRLTAVPREYWVQIDFIWHCCWHVWGSSLQIFKCWAYCQLCAGLIAITVFVISKCLC